MDSIVTVLLKATDLVLKITGSPTFKDFVASIKDYDKETQMLAETIHFIGDVLSDVEGLQFKGKSSEINAYNRLRIAYLDAEDFVDRIETTRKMLEAEDRMIKQAEEEIVLKANSKGMRCGSLASAPIKIKSITTKTCRFFSFRKFTKVHDEIKEIRRNLDAISNDLQKFGLGKCSIMESSGLRARPTGPFVNAMSIIGRDDDKKKIIDLLLGSSSTDQGQISVVSIVGIGGLGKTTCAQLVYDDIGNSQLESCKFDLKLWVSDSQKFDLKLLIQKILQACGLDDMNLQNLEMVSLQNRLKEKISGKKYLLVLDDVENEDFRHWKELKDLLMLGRKGSIILVTTRSRRVAKIMSSDSMTHELKGLSEEDSRLLFEEWAFEGSKVENLVEIGKCIVPKCGGVPLAIKTIGSLLRGRPDIKWKQVKDKDLVKIEDDSNDIIPILRVSYDALDLKAKECFRYCALFPKSKGISKRMLFNIWMSNVHFQTNRGEQTEDMWEDIIWTLYDRCFLEKMEKRNYDGDEYFKMHDLMHDLAKQVAGAEMFVVGSDVLLDSGSLTLEENIRHLGLTYTRTSAHISRFEPKGRRFRTLVNCDICYRYGNNPWQKLLSVDKLKSNFPFLRMLDLQSSNIDRLPDSVGELIHLRYLDLSGNEFNTLPDSIGKLWNLQTLLLKWCDKLVKLPVGIQQLINLRHLDLESCNSLTHPMPSGMGALKSLRTLKMFIVGDSESERTAMLEDLKPLSDLQGELTIKLPNKCTLKEEPDSGGALLLNKKGLKTLIIEWSKSRYIDPSLWFDLVLASEDLGNDMGVLSKLQPHFDLEKLKLSNYESLRLSPWTDNFASLLPSLVSLEIDDSVRCQRLPSFSKLPWLKSFTVYRLLSLEYMEENVPAVGAPFFPSLKYFKLQKLPKLKGWCRDLAGVEEQFSLLPSFPHHLEQLFIRECPNLRMTSMPPSPIFRHFFLNHDNFERSELERYAPSVINFHNYYLSRDCEKFPPDEDENDSVVLSSPMVRIAGDGEFKADNMQLFMSIPWERSIYGIPTVLSIYGFNVFDISPASMVEASFSRMPKYITSLHINNIPKLKTFPKVLRHLAALQELYIVKCPDLTGEECEQVSSTSTETRESSAPELVCHTPWKGFESLRCLSLNGLPKLVRIPKEILSPTSLQVLNIEFCEELKVFPTEVLKLINLQYLRLSQRNYSGVKSLYMRSGVSNLALLEFNYCRLERPLLQSLCQYQWLKHLKLSHIPMLEYVQDDNSAAFSFPSLEIISLLFLPDLRDWCKRIKASSSATCSEKEQSLQQLFPRLSRLNIQSCPNFYEKSILLSAVSVFIFGNRSPAFPKSSSSSSSLSCALYTDNASLCKTVMLEQYLQGNPLSVVIGHDEITAVWMKLDLGRVSSHLTSLYLGCSKNLRTLPAELKHLKTLENLSIVGYKRFCIWEEDEEDKQSEDRSPCDWLKSLTHLEFMDLPNMKTLPEWIQRIPSLQDVEICGCDTLVLPDWVHKNFCKVSLSENQGFHLVRKSIDGRSTTTTQLNN